jgi:hypothetical protein
MRILALPILAIVVSIGPAAAQTYDPAYAVCTARPPITNAATRHSMQRVGIGPLGTVRHQSILYRWHRRVY